MVNKLNREGYPNLFAEMAMANSAVKGLFEVFQSNPKAVVGGNSDSRQVRVSIARDFLWERYRARYPFA